MGKLNGSEGCLRGIALSNNAFVAYIPFAAAANNARWRREICYASARFLHSDSKRLTIGVRNLYVVYWSIMAEANGS